MNYQFALPNIDGHQISFADFPDAKGFAVVFTCNHCPYAIAYELRLIALHNEFASQGVPIIAINSNDARQYPLDSFEQMQVRAAQRGFPFPYLHDEDQSTAHNYGALKTPHVFLLARKGDALVKVYEGAIDDNYSNARAVQVHYLADAIKALLEGQLPSQAQTVPVGCSVKWKPA